MNQYFAKIFQLYHDYENDCSEMCYCATGGLHCQTECIQPISCKSDNAFYKHGAPAYQAFRGRCLCYSSKFICMRPTLGNFKSHEVVKRAYSVIRGLRRFDVICIFFWFRYLYAATGSVCIHRVQRYR